MIIKNKDGSEEVIKYVAVPIPVEDKPVPYDPIDEDILYISKGNISRKIGEYGTYVEAHIPKPIPKEIAPCPCDPSDEDIEYRFDKAIKNNKSPKKLDRAKLHAYTQSYGSSTTARIPVPSPVKEVNLFPDHPITKCSFCNNILFPGKIKCHICGYDMSKKVSTKIDHNPEASHKTHHTVKWYCVKCNARGTSWVKNKEDLSKCPNCGNTSGGSFTVLKVAPQGQCTIAPIWDWRNS